MKSSVSMALRGVGWDCVLQILSLFTRLSVGRISALRNLPRRGDCRDQNELELDGLPFEVIWSDEAALYVPSVLMRGQKKGRVGARSTCLSEHLSRCSNQGGTARRTFGYACGPL
jgi:hypothetical protein